MKSPFRALTALALGAMALFAAVGALGQDETHDNDYYVAKSTKRTATLLRNVERYHYQPGINALQRRNFKVAHSQFHFMLRYFPNHPMALGRMGEVGIESKRPDQAEPYFQRAIELYPKYATSYVLYGVFLQKSGRSKEAVQKLQKALELDDTSMSAHYNLGLVYLALNEFQQANVHAQKAYALGAPLPGLRRKLEAAGAWKPIERVSTTSAAPGPAPKPVQSSK